MLFLLKTLQSLWNRHREDKNYLLLQDLVLRTMEEGGRSLKVNLNQSVEGRYGPKRVYCGGEATVFKLTSSQIPPSSLPRSRLSFHVTPRSDPDQEEEYQQENKNYNSWGLVAED